VLRDCEKGPLREKYRKRTTSLILFWSRGSNLSRSVRQKGERTYWWCCISEQHGGIVILKREAILIHGILIHNRLRVFLYKTKTEGRTNSIEWPWSTLNTMKGEQEGGSHIRKEKALGAAYAR